MQVEPEFNVKRYMTFVQLFLCVMNLVTNSSTNAEVACIMGGWGVMELRGCDLGRLVDERLKLEDQT